MLKTNLKEEIRNLCKEKNAVIMAHYYQDKEIQDIADYIGDSLALAQWAKKTDAEIIVICGVHFMGETAKILSPSKKVLVPDLNAGCSLADSCSANDLAKFIKNYPGYKVVSYVNTTAEVKALTDICVTSTNAKKIIEMLPKEEKLIFGPDRNLGNYINQSTGRKMILWNGACHVHERFSLNKVIDLKTKHPTAKVLTHPECKEEIVKISDYIGSTKALIDIATKSEENQFIVCTESGVIHEMKKKNPNKTFLAVEIDKDSNCNTCEYMRLNTLEKLYNCLKNGSPEVIVKEEIRQKAESSILRMLEMS